VYPDFLVGPLVVVGKKYGFAQNCPSELGDRFVVKAVFDFNAFTNGGKSYCTPSFCKKEKGERLPQQSLSPSQIMFLKFPLRECFCVVF